VKLSLRPERSNLWPTEIASSRDALLAITPLSSGRNPPRDRVGHFPDRLDLSLCSLRLVRAVLQSRWLGCRLI